MPIRNDYTDALNDLHDAPPPGTLVPLPWWGQVGYAACILGYVVLMWLGLLWLLRMA